MKKELTKAALALVLGFFAVACTSDALVEPVTPDSELVEILLNGGVSFAVSPDAKVASSSADGGALPATRAVINKKHGEVALAFARVNATAAGSSAAYPAWSSTTVNEVKCLNATLASNTDDATPAEKDITFAAPQFYLSSGFYTKLVGWAPSVASDSNGSTYTTGTASTFSAGTVTCPIDGETDIMLSQELQGNKDEATRFSAANPFVFKHLLTQIKVSAYAADAAGKEQWGQITGIKVKGEADKQCQIVLPGTVTYPLQSGKTTAGDLPLIFKAVADDTTIATPLTLYYDGETGAPASGYKQECGYAMFAPVDAVGGKATVTVLVSTTGGPDGKAITDWEVPVEVLSTGGFKAGTAYGVTLKFSAQTIGISGTVEEWTDYDWTTGGGSFDGTITL